MHLLISNRNCGIIRCDKKGAMVIKSQWELYTDAELQAGADRWGLTVQQERQRIRLIQSNYRLWPSELLAYVQQKHKGSNLEFIGSTQMQNNVVLWLKQGNSIPVSVNVATAA
jgi:hypothetical protein